jgi:hypothetical protein
MRWVALWKDQLIGTYWFKNSITSEMYFKMLKDNVMPNTYGFNMMVPYHTSLRIGTECSLVERGPWNGHPDRQFHVGTSGLKCLHTLLLKA